MKQRKGGKRKGEKSNGGYRETDREGGKARGGR